MKKVIFVLTSAIALTGCVSLKTDMVNADGTFRNCAASGGGFGLGAVVGAASAAAMRSNCVSTQKKSGFLEADDAGTLKLKVSAHENSKLVVEESSVSGIQVGDTLLAINGKPISTPQEFTANAFGLIDTPVELKIARADSEITQKVKRTAFDKAPAK